jgi:hypothetical protein
MRAKAEEKEEEYYLLLLVSQGGLCVHTGREACCSFSCILLVQGATAKYLYSLSALSLFTAFAYC